MTTPTTKKEPLFHIVKRGNVTWKQAILIRAIAIVAALIVSGIIIVLIIHENPFSIYGSMLLGAFGTKRRIWNLLQGMSILLCISLACTPAFKMRFWNCGAEGQTLAAGLATATVMVYCGGKLPTVLLLFVMIIASLAAGMVWAVIPAIFKAKWNTNETLFTLMMNYIAIQLVSFATKSWATDGSGVLRPMPQYGFPKLFGKEYLLNIVIVAVLTVVMYIYLKYSKQGYEISVVGESENTARYIGINVKKVIIRTLMLSGALCGLAGFLLVGCTSYTVNTASVGGQGFTAIMVSWLAKFNPLFMVLTTFLIVFLNLGSKQVSTDFRLDDSICDIVTAIILFFIIGCEFFIQYRVVFRSKKHEK